MAGDATATRLEPIDRARLRKLSRDTGQSEYSLVREMLTESLRRLVPFVDLTDGYGGDAQRAG